MVIYDQLRISDDGQKLYIDAHVNQAECFKDRYISRVTVCTEDQVSEVSPEIHGDNFIYQQNIEPSTEIVPVYERVQILTEHLLVNHANSKGGWTISYQGNEESDNNSIHLVMSGKFPQFDTGLTPKLIVTSEAYNPDEEDIDSTDVLFTLEGSIIETSEHRMWKFKGKGNIKNVHTLCFYLYSQIDDEEYELVPLTSTSDVNFLKFLWNIYIEASDVNKKSVHLVLDCSSFNEKFKGNDLSHNMFFVYTECTGNVPINVPCRFDENTTLGVTFDYGIYYNQAMSYTKELGDKCTMSSQFIDFILNMEALNLAIETEHYVPAINYWKMLLDKDSVFEYTKPCGCHG